MKQQRGNYFKSKFDLINSQENSEEIIWSCSDSSEYENSYNEINVTTVKRKRKRVKGKKEKSKNISNLDVTFVDVKLEKNNVEELQNRSNIGSVSNCLSPILNSQRYFAPFKTKTTPGCLNRSNHKENQPTSPVLILKHNSPKLSPKVTKKLFSNENIDEVSHNRSISPVLSCTDIRLRKMTRDRDQIINDVCNRNKTVRKENTHAQSKKKLRYDNVSDNLQYGIFERNEYCDNDNRLCKYEDRNSENNEVNLDDTLTNKTASVVLVQRVKSYFDSYFSSTTNSQHSISEYESKSSPKSNDDIDIVNSLPDNKQTHTDDRSSSDSLKYLDCYRQTKKIKYKKDGLAYRLNTLLKKQNASTSLWYHERFLAVNSNFILPQEEYFALRVQDVSFKYGCFLVKALNADGDKFLIIVNNLHSKTNIVEINSFLKLYKPYQIIDFNDYKLITNVCKYECVTNKS